ncbi:YggT family protein [Inediibacterium massiliense]|uniref:YggT family protein n=1 Tax=Inediibacterium massiliense TaxID=1658111 RepID=UPI0006B49149|nr:YggT family protein [Inediibacterium massiliense]
MWMMVRSVEYFFRVLNFLILVRILLSWIQPHGYGTITKVIYQLTEPILAPFRKLLQNFNIGMGMIDISPILAVLFLDLIRKVILSLLY